MPTPLYQRALRLSLLLVFGAYLLVVTGCSSDQQPPTAVNSAQMAPEQAGALVFGFGDQPAAKKTKGDKRTKTKKIGPRGGSITVKDDGDRGGKDDLKVKLKVPKGALDERTAITVTLHGDELEDLVVEFAPSGLVFNKPAELILSVGKDLVDDLDELTIIHVSEDGSEPVPYELGETKNGIAIRVKVHGFSRYGMGGGD